jgi:hypothetical protein
VIIDYRLRAPPPQAMFDTKPRQLQTPFVAASALFYRDLPSSEVVRALTAFFTARAVDAQTTAKPEVMSIGELLMASKQLINSGAALDGRRTPAGD